MALDDVCTTVVRAAGGRRRFLVALAGPPATGKTTLAHDMAQALSARGERVAVVPMDGFHLDNETLHARGHLARKGAPFTFDAEGFVAMVARLALADGEISVPGFDRAADATFQHASVISNEDRIVLVEGNYLLLDTAPWSALRQHFDLTIFVHTPLDVIEQRLVARWTTHGLDETAALARAQQNDLPNARLVLEQSRDADFVLER